MSIERLSEWECDLERALLAVSGSHVEEWVLHCLAETNSTMDYARCLIPEVDVKRPVLILAKSQIAGRGRSGRKWVGIDSAFLGTYLFRTAGIAAEVNGFSLAVGLVTCQILCSLGCDIRVKWPNDLISSDGEKLGGILVEILHGSSEKYYLVGIGVNLKGDLEQIETAARPSTVFDQIGVVISPVQLAARLSWPIFDCFKRFQSEGFRPFRGSWLSRAAYLNDVFLVKTSIGDICGRFIGVSEQGALLLETGQGVEEVSSGHVLSITEGT